MLKVMTIGGAMLLAIPAFAQTGTSAAGSGQVSTGIHTSAPGTNTDTNTVTGVTGLPSNPPPVQTETRTGTSTNTTSTGLNTSTGMSTNMGTSLSTGANRPIGSTLSTSPSLTTRTTGSAYTGMGGPEDPGAMVGVTAGAKHYARCSRSVRDACSQMAPRRR